MQSKVVFVFLVVVILATLASCATTTEGPLGERFSLGQGLVKQYCVPCIGIVKFLENNTDLIKDIINEVCIKFLPNNICTEVTKIEDIVIKILFDLKKSPKQMCELINLC